jgi:hypothetical protein
VDEVSGDYMDAWLNPLPAETVIGAFAGAILGSILERNDYLDLSNWMHSFYVLQFIFLILAFGICAHFYCAAAYLDKPAIRKWCSFGCFFTIVLVVIMYPKHLGIGDDASINFLPHPYNVLMAGLLVLWLAALRALTQLKLLSREDS